MSQSKSKRTKLKQSHRQHKNGYTASSINDEYSKLMQDMKSRQERELRARAAVVDPIDRGSYQCDPEIPVRCIRGSRGENAMFAERQLDRANSIINFTPEDILRTQRQLSLVPPSDRFRYVTAPQTSIGMYKGRPLAIRLVSKFRKEELRLFYRDEVEWQCYPGIGRVEKTTFTRKYVGCAPV